MGGVAVIMFLYFNGHYVAEVNKISFYDRVFNFADGIYTVIAVNKGVIVDFASHLSSLRSGLKALGIDDSVSPAIRLVINRLLELNRVDSCKCYVIISRGNNVQERCHWSKNAIKGASLYVALSDWSLNGFPASIAKISVACIEDKRHGYSYLKTTNMLANIMAKKQAFSFGCDDALLIKGTLC